MWQCTVQYLEVMFFLYVLFCSKMCLFLSLWLSSGALELFFLL